MPKRKETPQAPPTPTPSSRSGLRNSVPSPPTAAPPSPPPPKRVRAIKPETNKYATTFLAATLPEEILRLIFSHIDPFIRDHPNPTIYPWMRKAYWMPFQLLNLALVSKRFYSIVEELFLATTFQAWVHRFVKLKYMKRVRGWAPIVKMCLKHPHLGGWLRVVRIECAERYAWETVKEGEVGDKGRVLVKRDVWYESDFERADRVIEGLCSRDIWDSPPLKPGGEGGKVKGGDEMKKRWKEHVRLGRSDALLALLFASTPNFETLVLESFQSPREEKSLENWSDFAVGGDTNYLTRLFRFATNSQMAVQKDDKHGHALLPCLSSIEIQRNGYTDTSGHQALTVTETLPYLTLLSLLSATIAPLAPDPDQAATNLPDIKLGLKTLTIESLPASVFPASDLLSLCPQVSDFSYAEDWMDTLYPDDSEAPNGILPHLVSTNLATQIKRLTLGRRSLADPDISSIRKFENLTSLTVGGRNLAVLFRRSDPAALWRALPPSLESVRIWNISHIGHAEDGYEGDEEGYEKVADALRALPGVREKGWMPRLKEVVIQEQRFENVRHPEWAENWYALDGACKAVSTQSVGVRVVGGASLDQQHWL